MTAEIKAPLPGTPLPPGENFLDAVAAAMLARCAALGLAGDLSCVRVLVPALPIGIELRQAFIAVSGQALLLPRFDTLSHWVQNEVLPGIPDPLADSQRLVLLHEALRSRGWFDENALWGIAEEMAALFDELTAAAVHLPDDEAALTRQLERAYALRASQPLAFESRVVHELWRALSAAGRPDVAGVYRLRLARLADGQHEANAIQTPCHSGLDPESSGAHLDSGFRRNDEASPRIHRDCRPEEMAQAARQPLLVLLDAAPDEALAPAERDFLARYGERQPMAIFYPTPRVAADLPLMRTLAAAWPENVPEDRPAPLYERAQELARLLPESPLHERLQLVAAAGREQEALAAVAQVGDWLVQGLRRIALISQDRLTARRVRALLEREGILVVDETGWKLSTSRAAATIDALIETTAGGAYYRDLLDLCKSPYVFADVDEAARKAAVYTLENAIRTGSARAGLPRIRRSLLDYRGAVAGSQVETGGCGSGLARERTSEAPISRASPLPHNNEVDCLPDDARSLGLTLLDRIEAATTLLRSRPAPLSRWIVRLEKALEAIGALAPLRADIAGQVLLELLATRRGELDDRGEPFSFAAWRDWLNREIEAASFRDGGIASPLVVTPLNAVCMRRFEAALLIGGDARQLAPAPGGTFFNQAVRRELGLRTRQHAETELRRDLELLLATVPRVVVTWQSEVDDEANLLAPEFDLLATVHRLAWNDDLHRPPRAARRAAQPDARTAPAATQAAAPVAPPALIPRRISVSAYETLVSCPYRFFARHVLGLGEMDEVSEEMAKSDYGALVHRLLERFHRRHPLVSALPPDEALAALQGCVDEVFAPAIEDNFLAIGWRLRWEQRLPAYLDWQRSQETAGWRWAQAEVPVRLTLPLIGDQAGANRCGSHETNGSAIRHSGLDPESRTPSLDSGLRRNDEGNPRIQHDSLPPGVELYGRIDRIDRIGNGPPGECGVSLLDYKTQTATAIRQRLADDVQLPAYALLHGDAARAAYVALDDEAITAVSTSDGEEDGRLMFDAAAQDHRLRAIFGALYGGAALPANGVDRVCRWCEMRGLCRRDHA